MNKRVISQILYHLAVLIMLVATVGFSIGGAGIDIDNLSKLTSDSYALNHLRASLLVGTTAFGLTTLLIMVGAWMRRVGDEKGRVILVTSCLPGLISSAQILWLTPSDASHILPFIAVPILVIFGLLLDKK